MTFAELTGAATYIVHLSCKEALDEALAARQRGVRVGVETLIQYLLLDKTDAERANFEGAKFVMSPPLRDKRNQAVLWNGLRSGLVQTVATDHAPFDFTNAEADGPRRFHQNSQRHPVARRTREAALHLRREDRQDSTCNTFVDVASTQAAKLFGLFPRKGTIAARQRRRSRHLRSRLPRHHLRRRRRRWPSTTAPSKAGQLEGRPERRHRARRGRGARREVRRHARPRAVPASASRRTAEARGVRGGSCQRRTSLAYAASKRRARRRQIERRAPNRSRCRAPRRRSTARAVAMNFGDAHRSRRDAVVEQCAQRCATLRGGESASRSCARISRRAAGCLRRGGGGGRWDIRLRCAACSCRREEDLHGVGDGALLRVEVVAAVARLFAGVIFARSASMRGSAAIASS